jgi:undecaprenyl-diphosphatase
MSFYELLKYIVMGIVQGITEVLPVSSSGHVTISQQLLGIDLDRGLLFLIIVNSGSLVAIIYHFRAIIKRLIFNFTRYAFYPSTRIATKDDFDYSMAIVVATIPAGVAGLLFTNPIEDLYALYGLIIVGLGLLVTATFLFIVKDSSRRNIRQTVTIKDAVLIGFAQMFAIIPGLSRSGMTTSSGLMRKVSMETALVFSFLLYVPLSIGSFLRYFFFIVSKSDPDVINLFPGDFYHIVYYFAAFIASMFATRYSLKFIFKLFRSGKLVYFSIYCFAVGMIALLVGVMNLS